MKVTLMERSWLWRSFVMTCLLTKNIWRNCIPICWSPVTVASAWKQTFWAQYTVTVPWIMCVMLISVRLRQLNIILSLWFVFIVALVGLVDFLFKVNFSFYKYLIGSIYWHIEGCFPCIIVGFFIGLTCQLKMFNFTCSLFCSWCNRLWYLSRPSKGLGISSSQFDKLQAPRQHLA